MRAIALDTAVLVVCCWAGLRLFRSAWTCTVRPPRISMVAPVSPALVIAVCTVAVVTPGAVTSHEDPPLKSMPQLNPRVAIDAMPATMMTVDSRYHHRRRPMKLNLVSPRYSRMRTLGGVSEYWLVASSTVVIVRLHCPRQGPGPRR